MNSATANRMTRHQVTITITIGLLTSMGSTCPFDPHNQRNRLEEHRTLSAPKLG